MIEIIYLAFMSLCNRARGSKLFEHTDSTVIGRLIALLSMSIATTFMLAETIDQAITMLAWIWASLMIWASFAWINFEAACVGSNLYDPNKPTFFPSDWALKKIPYFTSLYTDPQYGSIRARLWGLMGFGIRMFLAAIPIVGTALLTHPSHAIYAIFTPLLAVPYFIAGYTIQPKSGMVGELGAGAILGVLMIL